MRIFLAGASGAVGRRLVPLLVANGHQVFGTTRTPAKADQLRVNGAKPVVLDALDRGAVLRAVAAAQPDVIVHELTALSSMRSLKKMDQELAATNRLRTEGLDNLLEAARASGAKRFVAQSYSNGAATPSPAPKAMMKTVEALRYVETKVPAATDLTGIVLRYGSFYGPGTSIAVDGAIVQMVRKRRFPIFGNGAGIWCFIHIDDVARATVHAIEEGAPGLYNIVDNDPAKVEDWLPELARVLNAKPPYHMPAWLGRLLIGDAGMAAMTEARALSNEEARRALNWQPMYSSWRQGFRSSLLPTPFREPTAPTSIGRRDGDSGPGREDDSSGAARTR